MTNPNITDIVVVQDRSGSMQNIVTAAESGINEFLNAQKQGPGEVFLTFVQFDNVIETVSLRTPLTKFEGYVLQPRGGTALLDAIGRTINMLGSTYRSMSENQRPGKVFFVVNTDGEENQSREYKLDKIHDMITEQRDKYAWEFVFLGANQDAIQSGTRMGFAAASSMTYAGNDVAVAAAYTATTNSVLRSRVGGQSVSFTEDEREASVEGQ